jgi:CheY-like chemotaxis protein
METESSVRFVGRTMALSRNKILVVGNTQEGLSLIREALSFHDFDVIGVNQPLEALQRIERTPFDGLITDLVMAPISGLELTDQIRARHPARNLPILVLTGKEVGREDRQRLRQSACTYLPKTARVGDLITKVLELVAPKPPSRESA